MWIVCGLRVGTVCARVGLLASPDLVDRLLVSPTNSNGLTDGGSRACRSCEMWGSQLEGERVSSFATSSAKKRSACVVSLASLPRVAPQLHESTSSLGQLSQEKHGLSTSCSASS
ncbi:hypothetical protein L1887_42040 [Cichorium endivia]|nr:hypothetical protein L1887_42040 [Cichorium endivia]